MTSLLDVIRGHALRRPRDLALDDLAGSAVSWRELVGAVEARARLLRGCGVRSLGLFSDNGIPWVVSDLAAHVAGIATVPLPTFFSDAQLEHVCRTADLDAVVTDQPDRTEALGFSPQIHLRAGDHWLARRETDARQLGSIQKITFTSGTTGAPKGVCLGREHLELVARTLATATGSLASDVHLCLLPLSILLENIAGVHRSLLAGGTVLVPSLAHVGLAGAQQFDPFQSLGVVRACRATSAILVPEMLRGLLLAARDGRPTRLRYVGVGGARVAPSLLAESKACEIPAYEGYGLSEFASVVALNTPQHSKPGASGLPLPHVDVRLSDRGEIQVRGPHFQGYLTAKGIEAPRTREDGYWATGDLGELDEEGFLRVTGRLRNVLITSYGRNVSPEWVESELLTHPAVAQAVVFGDGEPALQAVIVARGEPSLIPDHLTAVNARLPDYARIARCVVTTRPFSEVGGLTHSTGMPRRDAVAMRFSRTSYETTPQMEQDPWAFTLAS